jgi:uncharacterized protein
VVSANASPQPGVLAPLVVGFDLDMTLIDARSGISAAWQALSRETGVHVDAGLVVTRLGPPVEQEVARWFPAEQVESVAERYRAIYRDVAATGVVAMPGAGEALAAVRAQHGSTVAVTAKHEPNARLNVAHVGLDLDEVVGDLWAEAKGYALAERGGSVYVGDHVHDVIAARAAGACAVAVATGPCTRDELLAAGADVVLASLSEFPAWLDTHLLDVRAAALEERLAALGSVVVAFSGGADSALLLAAAVQALGADRVVAATAYSDSLPRGERAPAADFAAALGVRLLTPRTYEMAREGYRANGGDRCYFCKTELYGRLGEVARREGLSVVVDGTNQDDGDDFRPGMRAARDLGVRSPLREVGLSKAEIRALSSRLGLRTWDKPAVACLSSRFAYGDPITVEKLNRVADAESGLRRLGFRGFRVRHHGNLARLELPEDRMAEALARHAEVVAAIKEAGYQYVALDLEGYRAGSQNEVLHARLQPGGLRRPRAV